MFRIVLLVLGSLALFGAPARALTQCDFNFEVNTESSALQSLIDGAQERGGFWLPIREAPDDVQAMGRFIGRLDVCLVTPDGKPRTIRIGGRSQEIPSPYVTTCTAALLPGNRLLANRHCYYEPALVKAGFTFVQEARINFGYVSEDFIDNVKTFHVSTRELAQDAGTDALVLQIVGADANQELGGHVPMRMETRATPRRALIMIHHPRRQPQRFSAGTCRIDPTQADLPESAAQLRHSCETSGGSSGALLLDARSLAVVGLHNRGGLSARGGHNGGYKIAAVEAALNLGFKEVRTSEPGVDPEGDAQAALTAALLIRGLDGRAAALARVERDHAGTRAAALAARERADLHEDRANAALDAAERLSDPSRQKAALERVARDFAETRAADRAQRMLVFLQPKGPSRDEQATTKLLEALRAPDDAVQKPLLEAILKKFSGTAAAKSAEAMLAKMAVPTPKAAAVPTLRVKQDGSGDFRAIAEAVAAAKPGTRIEIYPGTYKGGVRVGKELEIVGVGERDKIIWEAKDDDVILWTAQKGRIANLSLRQTGENFYGVRFRGGSALLENCDLTSTGGPSKGAPIVGIFSSGANPVLRNNVIHDGKSFGVFVSFKGRGTLERNKIYGNQTAQIGVTKEGDAVLRNNVIGPGPRLAVFVNKGGKGTIIGNDLRGNKAGAFSIQSDAGTVIRRDNKQ